jgi:hypothetical protein
MSGAEAASVFATDASGTSPPPLPVTEIRDSPLVDEEDEIGGAIGLMYTF